MINNILENVKRGDKYLTSNGKTAIYFKDLEFLVENTIIVYENDGKYPYDSNLDLVSKCDEPATTEELRMIETYEYNFFLNKIYNR